MEKKTFLILVADDEFWVRENLRTLLNWEKYGFTFLEPAVDGEDALVRMRETKPDIIITDINMPFLSGIDLIHQIREEFPDTAVLVLSGYQDFDYVRESLLAGAVDYLLKPVNKNNLLKVLLKAVDFLTDRRREQKEQIVVREKLKIASSVLRDRELSQLIHRTTDPQQKKWIKDNLMELDLEFSGFTLVLFRRVGPLERKAAMDSNRLAFECKKMISEYAADGKNIVFNNAYRTNEYILISDLEEKKLETCIARIVSEWDRSVGFRVNASFGHHYFSFQSLLEAYREAVLAQMTVIFGKAGLLIHMEEAAVPVAKRMTPEQEKQLEFAAQSMNGNLFRETALSRIGLNQMKTWRMGEIRQTFESMIWILRSHIPANAPPSQLLAIENLAEVLLQAVENHDSDEVLNVFSQILDEFFDSCAPSGLSESIQKTVRQVQDYISEHYFEDLSLGSLSGRFLVESSYLSKTFKQSTGCNLMLYIAKERIKHAKGYIKKEKLSLTEISQLVGYSDYGYFNRVFRKVVGKSPREYKESFAAGREGCI